MKWVVERRKTIMWAIAVLIALGIAIPVLSAKANSNGFEVKQTKEGEPLQVRMFGEALFDIQVNPCEVVSSADLDPSDLLGGKWDIYYVRLPEKEIAVLYFDGNAIEETNIILFDGKKFTCP